MVKDKQYTVPALVEVFWWDHYSLGDDWYHTDTKHEPCILSAVGYLVAEDDHYYYVSSTYEIASKDYSSGTAVLKNCVTQFNRIREQTAILWDGSGVHRPGARSRKPRGH